MPFETDKGGGFKIDASDLLKTGVYPERFDRQIPFWETVNGVQYTEFGMRRKAGREIVHDYKIAPQSSNTPMRGITATREFNTKVAYLGDLRNIYSYVLSDPLATPALSSSFNTVGTGYNLLRTSAGTEWDSGQEIEIASAVMSFGTLSITTVNPHGLISGIPFSLSGLGFTAPEIDPNGDHVATYPTGVAPVSPTTINVGGVGSLSDFATYTVSSSSKVILGQTNWDASETTWDEATNESDQWDFETFGSFVVGASGSGKPVIKKNNVNFNTFYNDQVSGATILSTNSGGTGYAVNDTITGMTDGGAPANTFAIKVTEVVGGVITAFAITNFGSGISSGQVISLGTTSGGGSGFTCTATVPNIDFDSLECFHRQGPHMLAFNYTKGAVGYSTSFAWCSADNLDDWVGTATNTAGSLLIREAETPIRCVTQLGNGLAVYTETQMFVVNYVGLPNIFGYQVALEGSVGAVSPNSVVSVGRKNYGVSRDGFFVTDGASVQMIGRESGMNQFFRDNATSNELAQVYGFDNSKENEVVWAVPLNESTITKEIYYNYKTGQWGMRDQTISCYLDRGIFHDALSADSIGNFYREGSVPTLTNSSVSAITKAHDLNDADRIKEISAIRVGKEGAGNPTLSVGFSSTIDATPTFLQKDSFIIDDTFKSFPIRAAGRYITIKIESDGSADNWTITNLVVQGRMEGER
jgi:hypothetical protein